MELKSGMNLFLLVSLCLCKFLTANPVVKDFSTKKHPNLCEYKGLTFSPGEDVYQEHDGCHVKRIKCAPDGQITVSMHYNCRTTRITEQTTGEQTTSEQTTMDDISESNLAGCLFEGVMYERGQTIYEGGHGTWCFGAVCSDEGHIMEWNDWNCDVQQKKETKAESDYTKYDTDILVPGCVVNGNFYLPGEIIQQKDEECRETICGVDGKQHEQNAC